MLDVSAVEFLAGFNEIQVVFLKLSLLDRLLFDIFLLVLSVLAAVS